MTSTPRTTSPISVIIPVLNEANRLAETIIAARGPHCREIIVADGGSSDNSREIAARLGAEVVNSPAGRGRQMNEGAKKAGGDTLLFVHADTLLPDNYGPHVIRALENPKVAGGAFRLGIRLPGLRPRLIEFGANLRSRFLQLPYGDQAIFTRRALFDEIGGYQELPILEDVLLVQQLKKRGKVATIGPTASTSGRRWQQLGFLRTTIINQKIMLAWLLGVPLEQLRAWYRLAEKG